MASKGDSEFISYEQSDSSNNNQSLTGSPYSWISAERVYENVQGRAYKGPKKVILWGTATFRN